MFAAAGPILLIFESVAGICLLVYDLGPGCIGSCAVSQYLVAAGTVQLRPYGGYWKGVLMCSRCWLKVSLYLVIMFIGLLAESIYLSAQLWSA